MSMKAYRSLDAALLAAQKHANQFNRPQYVYQSERTGHFYYQFRTVKIPASNITRILPAPKPKFGVILQPQPEFDFIATQIEWFADEDEAKALYNAWCVQERNLNSKFVVIFVDIRMYQKDAL